MRQHIQKESMVVIQKKWNAQDLGAALISALSLPVHTTSIDMSIKVGKPIKVKCEYWPGDIAHEDAEKLVHEFSLLKPDEPETTGPTIDELFELARDRIHNLVDLRAELAHLEIHRRATVAEHALNWMFKTEYEQRPIDIDINFKPFADAAKGMVDKLKITVEAMNKLCAMHKGDNHA